MKHTPLVSIITVVYNGKNQLESTINNISKQDYKNIEYIIVDGKSTDGTLEVIAANQSIITKHVSEPDNGIYDAMNKGLQLATGDYVLFLNAGDLFYADITLADMLSQAGGADVLYGDAAIMNAQGIITHLRDHKRLPKQLSAWHMRLGMVVCHQSLLVRRAIAPLYDLRYQIAADIDWTIRVLRQAKTVRNTGLVVCKFLEGGTSAKRRRRSWAERWDIIRRQFGLPVAIASHLQIVWQALWRALLAGKR
jgi:glycosyltransferase involved in cell wall biosynthesis